eukprot:jgi/Mesvir1/21853/Mv26180-RA.1
MADPSVTRKVRVAAAPSRSGSLAKLVRCESKPICSKPLERQIVEIAAVSAGLTLGPISPSFAAVTAVEPLEWSTSVGIAMTASCLAVLAIGRYSIKETGYGPDIPVIGRPRILKGFGVPEFLGTMAFGHVVGAGVILGLHAQGYL